MRKPHKMPRFHGAANRIFDRRKFLDGTFKTYFAPGQNAPVMASANYTAPTDWNVAGGLLRPPQVVWLTIAMIDADQSSYEITFVNGQYLIYQVTTNQHLLGTDGNFHDVEQSITSYWADGYSQTADVTYGPDDANGIPTIADPPHFVPDGIHLIDIGATDPDVHDDPTDPPATHVQIGGGMSAEDITENAAHTASYDNFVTNNQASEYARLRPIFESVKASIESLRPGRTWVEIVDYTTVIANNTITAFTGLIGGSATVATDDTDDYFGVDFLNVHAGAICLLGSFPSVGQTTLFADSYATSKDSVRSAYPKFAGYRAVLYGDSTAYDSFPDPPLYTTPVPPSLGAHDVLSHDNSSRINDFNTSRTNAVSDENSTLAARNGLVNSDLESLASDLSDVGFTYDGDSTDLTEDILVKLIADHFGFDPDTGADLPVGP